jgi:hypothetical protein
MKYLRDPLALTEIAEELREHAANVEKEAAESGKTQRAKPRIRRLRAVAREMDTAANRGGRLDEIDRDS